MIMKIKELLTVMYLSFMAMIQPSQAEVISMVVDEPYRFFHTSEKQYTTADVKAMVAQYGKNILIGGDPGWNENFEETRKAVHKYGARLHVYLMGPGMLEWSQEERDEMVKMAKRNGIDIMKKDWLEKWYEFGWKHEVQNSLMRYQDAYSVEIDNLDAVFKKPEDLISYYKELGDFIQSHGLKTKLVIKNLDEDTLTSLVIAVAAGEVDKELFASFGMFEKGSGDVRLQAILSKKIGITAITPLNGLLPTETYGTIKEGVERER